MNILFVDDEPNVLEGIGRALATRAPEEWNVTMAESGAHALLELERGAFDIVVSDMRMPGMDGAELLHRIADRWPQVARIVLSGHTDEATAVRAAAVAHQFLAKPCDVGLLITVLQQLARLNRAADASVRALVGGLNRLPSLPAVYAQFHKALADGGADARVIAEIIRKDPAISAKLLQLVNSAFFSRGRQTTDLSAAVTRLGTRIVRNIALAESLVGAMPTPTRFRLREMASRCLQAALVVERLAPYDCRDDASLAALLANVGLQVIAGTAPDQLDAALALAATRQLPLVEAERRIYGTTHAEVGGYLLALWGLPDVVAHAVADHHTLGATRDPVVTVAIHLAAHHAEGTPLDDGVLLGAGWVAADVRAALADLGGA